MPARQKISDKQFLEALYINHGDIPATANYLRHKHNVSYSHQAARKRATTKFANELRGIYLMAVNQANNRLRAMMADETCDVRLRARVALHLQSKLTKYRKYEIL
jgi:hypothetical protein